MTQRGRKQRKALRADSCKSGQRDGVRYCAPDSSDVKMGFAHALARFFCLIIEMPRKHSLTIAGHATSLTLEPIFWEALKAAAEAEDKPLAALVAEIDEARTTNLSSAIRVWLYERAIASAARE